MFDVDPAGFEQAADFGVIHAPGVDQSLGVVSINTLPLFVARRRCTLRAILGPEAAKGFPRYAAASVRIVRELNAIPLSKILKGSASMEQ